MILILIIVFLTRFYLGITGRGKPTLREEILELFTQVFISLFITFILATLMGIQT